MLSRTHALARRLRALRRDSALRRAEGVFVAEGLHLAEEAFSAGASIELAVVTPRLDATAEGRAIRRRLAAGGVEIHAATEATLEALQDARSPQPILLLARGAARPLGEVVADRGGLPLLVVADGIQDPGNLGGIVRTADAAGATGLVATAAGADLFHPRAVRATMGSIFRLPLAATPYGEATEQARRTGLVVVGAVPRDGTPYDRFDWRRPVALVLGGEGAGLPASAQEGLEERVTVPLRTGVESLSVGAAAAVLLFEAARSRARGE